SIASYTKMTTVDQVPTVNNNEPKKPSTPGATKFDGDGVVFKGKLIGTEDLSVDRDEKICLDSMFKLKAVAKARSDHKQKIQINLTLSAVKLADEVTKVSVASHEIERISFVVTDPKDARAFGYVYNTADDRHQFWAIKTERPAALTVVSLKELFDTAFEQFNNRTEKVKETVVTPPVIPATPTTVLPSDVTPPQTTQPPPPSIWEASAAVQPPVNQPFPANTNLFGFDPAPAPTQVPQPKSVNVIDSDDLWNVPTSSTNPHVQATPSNLTGPSNDLSSVFNAPTQPSNQFQPMFMQPQQPQQPQYQSNISFQQQAQFGQQPIPGQSQQPYGITPQYRQSPVPPQFGVTPTPIQPQQQTAPVNMPPPLLPSPLNPMQQQQLQQQSFLQNSPPTPVAPPSVTSPFADFDFFGQPVSSVNKPPTKEAFFPAQPVKSIQQLQMEKKFWIQRS
ncbi:unnamed protein product, partial [Didymodactylos carnosus]